VIYHENEIIMCKIMKNTKKKKIIMEASSQDKSGPPPQKQCMGKVIT